ncbi:2-methylcitrate dehydratase PrpD [Faunimonas pinastri]|uniref:2-methylcitrate dehydratase PrpD n=1 Tax=Faunimonas pinastri TaxID=1855383 RepID=A0A1H9B6N5_9HYPH|nr:MmgE/PrpD family protein [Faunimonas pinastri]SEP84682.1 2-methylcitrate dehydratase PrpD [Faunimonas pinastri]
MTPEPSSSSPIGRAIATALTAIRYEDIPEDVLATTRAFVLDTIGVIGAATHAPGMENLLAALGEWELGGSATLLLNGRTANPATAALANAAAAHSLDFDDQHDPARVHVFCVVLPAVLAAVEAEEMVHGRDALAAIAVGVELFCRLGLACYNSLGKGWHPTTALGSLAAAAAAGKVLKLDAEQMVHALGIAFVQMSGTTQFIADGALAKRLGPGFAARNGVLAAQMARHGLTGPWRFLEGEAGLFNLHERGEVRPEILTDGLGTEWHLRDLSMKPYPCCRCTHTVIELARDLRREGLTGDDIESGTIELGRVNRQIVGAAFDRSHPNPVVHAQFNAAYTFAAALRDGEVTIPTFLPERIRAADVAFAARLETREAADFEPTAIAPARVRLQLRDGSTIESTRLTIKGAPNDPMSEAEVLAKFRNCLNWGLGEDAAAIAALERIALHLDEQEDARDLVRSFLACRTEARAA